MEAKEIRAEIIRLKGELIRGACASQTEFETRCKEEAYDNVLNFIDSRYNHSIMSYKVFDMCMENNSPCKKEDCEFYKEQRRCIKYKLAFVCKYQRI